MCMQWRRVAKEKERDMQQRRVAQKERYMYAMEKVTRRKEGEVAMGRGKGELMRKL